MPAIFRSRERMLEPYFAKLDADWRGGCRNGAALWRSLRSGGFCGSLRVVAEWATRRRLSERPECLAGRLPPPARQLSRIMTMRRDHLSKADAVVVQLVGVPLVLGLRRILRVGLRRRIKLLVFRRAEPGPVYNLTARLVRRREVQQMRQPPMADAGFQQGAACRSHHGSCCARAISRLYPPSPRWRWSS